MTQETVGSAQRLDYIDNLRSTMIFMVVAQHAAVTYSHFGSWYYMAPEPIGQGEQVVFGLYQSHAQAFFMGLLFLLAGYFTPTAFDRKGFVRFVWDRFVRLGLPTLFFVFVIQDVLGHYLLRWHGDQPFWPNYVYYLTHWDWVDSTGPMWFAVALLVFSLVYALFRAALPKLRIVLGTPGVCAVLIGGLAVAGLSFLARTVWPIGGAWHNMQLGYFAQYVVFFAFGILARRGDWLASMSVCTGRRLLIGAAIAGPLCWFAVLLGGGVFRDGMANFNGGWHWQNLAFAAWEQLFAAAFCAGLIVLYREKFNAGGSFSKLISTNSFGIYVFHTPVLVAVTLAMASWVAPALVKFSVATLVAFAATLAVAMVARRVPLLKSIL